MAWIQSRLQATRATGPGSILRTQEAGDEVTTRTSCSKELTAWRTHHLAILQYQNPLLSAKCPPYKLPDAYAGTVDESLETSQSTKD